MAWGSHHRAQAWTSNQSLWTAARALHPTQAYPQWRLGVMAFQTDRGLARSYFRRARLALHDIPRTDPLTGVIWLWTDLAGGE